MAHRDKSIRELRRRAESYWFLAAIYGEPPASHVLARLMANTAGTVQGDDAGIGGELGSALALDLGTDRAILTHRLAIEHARLFLGLRQGYGPPPPYESLWRESRILGDSTLAVAKAYSEAGFMDASQCAPCDHLASELRFLASLCHAEAEAIASGNVGEASWARERQAAFLKDHLLTWVPHYCQELARQAREPWYAALARVTAAILAGEAQAMATARARSRGADAANHRAEGVAV
jgi:TorA maturation chaperone TorD